jgi:hypothetical protein
LVASKSQAGGGVIECLLSIRECDACIGISSFGPGLLVCRCHDPGQWQATPACGEKRRTTRKDIRLPEQPDAARWRQSSPTILATFFNAVDYAAERIMRLPANWRLKIMSPAILYAVANSTGSIKVASSASAFELFTRFDTGQRCR